MLLLDKKHSSPKNRGVILPTGVVMGEEFIYPFQGMEGNFIRAGVPPTSPSSSSTPISSIREFVT
ncbi:hypothetical protein [Paenibacillus ginsengarvi]|uniref:hypothetical protein n=1 Tax=Paenibacillus ginsengarvi TaxID=400777 RepID=UPI00195FA517|nr:hypothetical protein [Paenibacillus ginsengarvi]